jgi:hypothetical protein
MPCPQRNLEGRALFIRPGSRPRTCLSLDDCPESLFQNGWQGRAADRNRTMSPARAGCVCCVCPRLAGNGSVLTYDTFLPAGCGLVSKVRTDTFTSSAKASHWDQIDWNQCHRQVRRLQARIVQATLGLNRRVHRLRLTAGLLNGLSRMKGNFHVRFLGEGAAATPLLYPTVPPGYGTPHLCGSEELCRVPAAKPRRPRPFHPTRITPANVFC